MPFASPYGNGPKNLATPVPAGAQPGGLVMPSQGDVPSENPYMAVRNASPPPVAPVPPKAAANPYLQAASPATADPGASATPPQGPYDDARPDFNQNPPPGPVTQQIKDLWQRAKASFGSNPDQAAAILGKYYGEGNVRVSTDNQVEFRRDDKSKFQRMDPDHFEILGDVIADMIGPAVEGLVMGGTEAGMAGAGFAGAGPIGAAGAAITGAAAAGSAGAAARRGVVSAMGVDPNMGGASFQSDAMNGIAGSLVAKPIVGVGNWIKSQVAQAVEELPMNRLMGVARLRKAAEDTIVNSGPSGLSRREVGQNVIQAVDALHDRYEAGVGLVNSRAIQLNKDRVVPMPNAISKMREIIEREGGEILPSGEAIIPRNFESVSPSVASEIRTVTSDGMYGKSSSNYINSSKADPVDFASSPTATKPFGDPNGRAALKKLADDYNLYSRNQLDPGLSIRELINNVKAYQKLSKFDETNPFSPDTLQGYKDIQKAMGKDRDTLFQKIFKDQPEAPLLEKAYNDYSTHIEPITAFQDAFNAAKSPEAFADSLITKGGSQRIRDLKYILGENSDEFKQVKGSWINNMFNDSIDSKTGVFRAQNFINELDSHGKDVLNEMMSPGDMNKLKLIAAKANRIYTGDFSSTGTQSSMNDLVGFLSASPTKIVARTLFKLTGKNPQAQDYLLDKGFIEAAAKAQDTPSKLRIMEAMSDYETMVKPARRIGPTERVLKNVVGSGVEDSGRSMYNQR